jgi:hypothetical protein
MEIPIKKEIYEKYRNELYKINEDAKLMFNLDTTDINHSDNLKKIIEFQTRLVAMLNHALLNKIYWKKIINKIELHRNRIINKAKLEEPETEQKMTIDMKKAYAELKADEVLSKTLFDGESYANKMAAIQDNYYDAEAFYSEIENIYDYLSKIVMIIGIMNKIQPKNNDEIVSIGNFQIGGQDASQIG